MRLWEVIERLAKADPAKVIRHGFGAPHAWRGDYTQVAFAPAENVTVGEMLAHAKSALGATFPGWKGGEFTMTEHTECFIAEEGTYGGNNDALTARWLDAVLEDR